MPLSIVSFAEGNVAVYDAVLCICIRILFPKSDALSYAKKIFSLYVVLSLVYIPWIIYSNPSLNYKILLQFAVTSNIGWYFIALILWKALLPFFKSLRYSLLSFLAVCAIIYVYIRVGFDGYFEARNASVHKERWNYARYIFSIINYFWAFFPAFILGSTIHWEQIVSLRSQKWRWVLLLPLIIVFYLSTKKALPYVDAYILKWQPFLHFFCYSDAYFCMIFGFLACFPGRKIPLLTEMGQKSLTIYILHYWAVMPFNDMLKKSNRVFHWDAPFPNWPVLFWIVYVLLIVYFCSRNFCFNAVNRLAAWVERLLFAPAISASTMPAKTSASVAPSKNPRP